MSHAAQPTPTSSPTSAPAVSGAPARAAASTGTAQHPASPPALQLRGTGRRRAVDQLMRALAWLAAHDQF